MPVNSESPFPSSRFAYGFSAGQILQVDSALPHLTVCAAVINEEAACRPHAFSLYVRFLFPPSATTIFSAISSAR